MPTVQMHNDWAGARTLTSAIYRQLRAGILSTQFLPGQKLNVSQLAKDYSVSLASIREGLSRLVADGLVEAIDNRGFFVTPVSEQDLSDLTRTRIDIESLALRRSIQHGDSEWAQSIVSAFEQMESHPRREPSGSALNEAWIRAHEHFHRALVSACGSTWLLNFRDSLYEHSERYRRLSIPLQTETRDITAEHRAILDAAVRRDEQAATEALASHFNTTMQFALSSNPQSGNKLWREANIT